jgi:hypothetical protein
MPIYLDEVQAKRVKTTAEWGQYTCEMEYNPNDVTLGLAEKLQNTVSRSRQAQRANQAGEVDPNQPVQAVDLSWVTETVAMILKGWDVYMTHEDEEKKNPIAITAENMRKYLPGGLIMAMVTKLLEAFTFDPEPAQPLNGTSDSSS